MRARNALLAVGALAAVVVVIAVFAFDAPRDAAVSQAHASSVDRAAPASEPSALDNAPPHDERAQAAEPVATATPPPQDATPKTSPVPSDGLDVLVVRRADHSPVAGAELAFFESPGDGRPFDAGAWLRPGDGDERFEHAEHRYVADETGHARVPKVRTQAILVGRAEHLWGIKPLQRNQDQQPSELVLEPDGDLLARVVDAAGKPVANVPVALRRRQFGAFNDYLVARTDAEGQARLHHGHAIPPGRPKGWCVALRGVFEPPIETAIDDDPPADAVQLVAPPFGACDVAVLDERGQPCHDALSILLRVATQDTDGARLGNYARGGALLGDPTTEGHALFELVQLGAPLEAHVSRVGSDVEHVAQATGPTRAGEVARAVVQLGQHCCTLVGRVLAEDGKPPANTSVRARIERSPSNLPFEGDRALTLDAEGRFVYELSLESTRPTRTFTAYSVDAQGAELTSTSVPLPATLSIGLLDLGELTLGGSPLLASGTVLDHHGQPLAGASVTVATPFRVGASGEETMWRRAPGLSATSAADGRFEVRARLDATQIQVSARDADHSSEPVTTAPGARDVVLRMIASGRLAGRVLFDAAVIDGKSLGVQARGADPAPGEQRAMGFALVQGDGTFELRSLRTGTYEVMLRSEAFPYAVSLASIGDVVVAMDQTARDPRLDPLDLRGRLRAFDVDVADENGARIKDACVTLRWLDAGFASEPAVLYPNDGAARVVCGEHGVDVRASAPDMLDADSHGVVHDERLVLRPAGRVRLVLPSSVVLPEPPLYLAAQLAAENDPPNVNRGRAADFGVDHRAELSASFVGRARVSFIAKLRVENGWRTATLKNATPVWIDLRADRAEQEFAVSFECPDLDAVCQQLTARGR